MSLWRQLLRGFRILANRKGADREIDDEVAHYLEEATANLEAAGLSSEEARRAARLEIGSTVAVRETVRDYGWERSIETLVADVRYGIRRLRQTPVFTAVGALTLALGIGASAAIFSVVNPVLFQPLPYSDAERLTMIWDNREGVRLDITFGTYRELLNRSHSFESMAVTKPLQSSLTGRSDEPERLDGQYVSADYFRVLGVRPALGRDFQASDDQPHSPFVVIISDGLWRRKFSTDATIIGRQVLFDDNPATVIGILPRAFEDVLSPSAEIWSTLQYDPSLPLNGKEWGHHLRLLGRLRKGVHLDQARSELERIAGTSLAEFPRPQWASLDGGFIASSLQDDLTRPVRPVLWALLGAVVLLLTIACVNVANLLMARGADRRMELAVRAALGASRLRLIRQLLAETLLLAGIGGILGIVFAYSALDLAALRPPALPRADAITIDGHVLAFAFGLTTLVALAIGLFPALQGAGADLYGAAQQRSMRIAGSRQVTRRALVVVQVALAVMLLVGAGLLLRSLQNLFAVDPGFNAQNLLTMQVQATGAQFRDAGNTNRFFVQVLDAVRQVPGVSAAAFTSQLPLTGDQDTWGVHFESIPASTVDENRDWYRYAISPGYPEAMGIRLRAGRVLDSHDSTNAPLAAVINESFAKRRLPGRDPIGQRLHIGPDSGPWYTVVGVVADVNQTSLALNRGDAVYVTADQWRFEDRARWLVVRSEQDPTVLTPAIRRAIWSVDRNQPILRIATMEDRLNVSTSERWFALRMFEAFGVVALFLAAIGTYSLLSGSVTERTREIGVRSALGATRRSILALVLREGMKLASFGIVIGMAGAMITSRALVTLLFGVSRLDYATYLSVVILLTSISAIACGLPAWKAARVRPSIALRSE